MHGPAGQVPPPTVWSATPLFVNDTLYVGTPFYRIFALEPDTGAVKWTYDSHAVLEALTQPDLKNRGVAYWAAAEPAAGQPCQRRIYLGTMDAKLHGVDADTGQPCADFGQGGVARLQRLQHHRRQLAALAPAAADGLRRHPLPRLGRQGLGGGGRQPRLGLCARRPHRRGQVDLRHPPARRPRQDRHRQRLGLDVGRPRAPPPLRPGLQPQPQLLPGRRPARPPRRHLGDRARHRHRRPRLDPPARPPRPLGLRHQRRPDARRHREGRPHRPGAGADLEAGLPLRPRPHHRRARLPDRGAPGPADRRPRRALRRHATLRRPPRARRPRPLARRLQARRLRLRRLVLAAPPPACATTAPSRPRASRAASSTPPPSAASNGAAARSTRAPASSWSTTPRWCSSTASIPRADYEAAAAAPARPAASRR